MMKTSPILHTERLILRAFRLEDAADVQRLAKDPDVASATYEIEQHASEDGTAQEWLHWCHEWLEDGERTNFAITLRTDGTLIGTVELTFRAHLPARDAELGYWIGKPYWNCGYATEAAKAIVAYGFREHDIESIYAYYFARNPASGRVMQKIGMHYAEYIPKDPKRYFFEDTIQYRILKCEFIKNEVRAAPSYRKTTTSVAYT